MASLHICICVDKQLEAQVDAVRSRVPFGYAKDAQHTLPVGQSLSEAHSNRFGAAAGQLFSGVHCSFNGASPSCSKQHAVPRVQSSAAHGTNVEGASNPASGDVALSAVPPSPAGSPLDENDEQAIAASVTSTSPRQIATPRRMHVSLPHLERIPRREAPSPDICVAGWAAQTTTASEWTPLMRFALTLEASTGVSCGHGFRRRTGKDEYEDGDDPCQREVDDWRAKKRAKPEHCDSEAGTQR